MKVDIVTAARTSFDRRADQCTDEQNEGSQRIEQQVSELDNDASSRLPALMEDDDEA